MWCDHLDCKRLVLEVWNRPYWGCPMYILIQKLIALKLDLKKWNRDVFGNVQTNVENAMTILNGIQLHIDRFGYSYALHNLEIFA